eukprot:Sspe_Gene.42532::Locus_20652_Transcript_1_1_Confidence_1.000_Length_1689::g.42532::m.42532
MGLLALLLFAAFVRATPPSKHPLSHLSCASLSLSEQCSCETTRLRGASVSVAREEGRKATLSPTVLPSSLQVVEGEEGRELQFHGDVTLGEIIEVLQSVKLEADPGTWLVTYVLGGDPSERLYKFVGNSEAGCVKEPCSWEEGQAACADPRRWYLDLGVGYLATVTSEEEQQKVRRTTGAAAWLGGYQYLEDTAWRWVTGPEGCAPYPPNATGAVRSACDLGYPFEDTGFMACRKTTAECQRGTPFNYTKWATLEPNDFKGVDGECLLCLNTGEDFLGLVDTAFGVGWNDFPHKYHTIKGMVCEWGGVDAGCLPSRSGRVLVDPAGFHVVLNGKVVPPSPKGSLRDVPWHFTNSVGEWVSPPGEVELWCPVPCEVFLAVIATAPSEAVVSLIEEGWEVGRCAPLYYDEGWVPMHGLRRVFPAGKLVAFRVSATFALIPAEDSHRCEALDQKTCPTRDGCEWRGSCYRVWCPPLRPPAEPPCQCHMFA